MTVSRLNTEEGLVLVGAFQVGFTLLERLVAPDLVEKLHRTIAIF